MEAPEALSGNLLHGQESDNSLVCPTFIGPPDSPPQASPTRFPRLYKALTLSGLPAAGCQPTAIRTAVGHTQARLSGKGPSERVRITLGNETLPIVGPRACHPCLHWCGSGSNATGGECHRRWSELMRRLQTPGLMPVKAPKCRSRLPKVQEILRSYPLNIGSGGTVPPRLTRGSETRKGCRTLEEVKLRGCEAPDVGDLAEQRSTSTKGDSTTTTREGLKWVTSRLKS